MRDQLSNLIKDPQIAVLELELQRPNLFYVLKVQGVEIRHSNFLAWLLNPVASHGLGDLFLKYVLRDIFSSGEFDWIDEFAADELDLAGSEIRREWHNIDILVETPKFVICIENKFHSGEHSRQLQTYREDLRQHFPSKNHVFVYLTPHGQSPKGDEDKAEYQTYSYGNILDILLIILRVYGESISPKVLSYIDEYTTLIRREVMKEDALNELARRIYESHSEALEFIFENRPDRLAEVAPIFESFVTASGWVLESCNKGYTRFLTPELHKVIPRKGDRGWKNKESFLFELDFWPKTINFKTVIPPGDIRISDLLRKALSDVEGASKPRGSQWIVHFNVRWPYDISSSKYSDEDVSKKLESITPEIKDVVARVEAALLKVKF